MKGTQIFARKASLLVVSIACGLVTALTPGWRNDLRALEYLSLANCGLPNALQQPKKCDKYLNGWLQIQMTPLTVSYNKYK